MKLSIIIPIYNVEQYIEHCIKSILSQRADSDIVEIILVNDGTPDRSMEVANEIISKEKNVKIINQKNQGLSAARNAGLNVANGEYVWFVDSDDWLLPNALDDVIEAIAEYPTADVLSTILLDYIEDTKETYQEYYPKVFDLSGKTYLKLRYKQGASQRFIFKKQFLVKNNLTFSPNILHEDGLLGYKMLYLAEKVIILEKPVYVYRKRSGSIMTSITIKTPIDMLFIHKQLVEFCNKFVAEEDKLWYRQEIYKILIDLFNFSLNLSFDPLFAKFYYENKKYFNQESSLMIQQGFMKPISYRMKYFQLIYMKFKLTAKKILQK